MIKNSLRAFADGVLESKRIARQDVQKLRRDILAEGITSREEADTLIALERAVPAADAVFADYLVGAIVDFAVWGARPTGYVDQDTARWLVASLSCGAGPSETARRIAFEIVKEAEQVDEVLLAFVMRGSRRRPRGGPRFETPLHAAA
jgi:hypothetical protein